MQAFFRYFAFALCIFVRTRRVLNLGDWYTMRPGVPTLYKRNGPPDGMPILLHPRGEESRLGNVAGEQTLDGVDINRAVEGLVDDQAGGNPNLEFRVKVEVARGLHAARRSLP